MSKAVQSFTDSFLTWEQIPKEGDGKEVPSENLKSEEELAKFTVDARLSDVERTILYLNGGQQIQQSHAVRNLPSVLKGRGRAAWEAIAPSLKTALNKMDTAAQIEAAETFARMAQERALPPSDLQAGLLPITCRNVNKEKSEEEIEAWLQALFALIPFLDKDVLKAEVVTLALSKGEVEENWNSRCICARILGAVAKCLTREEIERSFFKQALSMCQDLDFHIRISMCEQLVAIGRAVAGGGGGGGGDLLSKQILEELPELLKDEEIKVRASAFNTLVALLDLLPPAVRKARVLPLLRSHMQPLDMEPEMQLCIARCFGTMLAAIKSDLEPDDLRMFLGCFRHLASTGRDELRCACALQLPSVLHTSCALSPGLFQAQFQDLVLMLLADGSEDVRAAAAEQLHEYCRAAGDGAAAATAFARPLARALRDASPRVRAAPLPHLAATLTSLAPADPSRREAAMSDIVKALVELEALGGNLQWRVQNQLALAFPAFPRAFTSDQIYEHFVPMAFRLLSSAAAAVRPAAAEGLALFLRHCRREQQRAETFRRLVREFVRHKSFGQRAAFAHVAQHLIAAFSSRFTKEWIFDLCMELLYDPVPNVRLQFSPLLPSLKQVIRLPEDVDLLERLNTAMSNVMTDNDRDVSVSSRAVNDAFKRLPVRMGMGSQVVEVNGALGSGGYEAQDRKREEEEAEMPGFTPEDSKDLKSEIMANGIRRRVPNGLGGMDAVGRPVARRSGTGVAPSAGGGSSGAPARPAARPGVGAGSGAGAGIGGARGAGQGAAGLAAKTGGPVSASTAGRGVGNGAAGGVKAAADSGGSRVQGAARQPMTGSTSKASTSPLKAAPGAAGVGAAGKLPLSGLKPAAGGMGSPLPSARVAPTAASASPKKLSK